MADNFSPERTFRAFLEFKRSPSWMSATNVSGYFGVLLGSLGDEAMEAWTIASRMHLIDDEECPDDALPVIGEDRRLQQYTLENSTQHRARLLDAWYIYEHAGTEKVINEQLRAAGYGPTDVIDEFGDPEVPFGSDEFAYGSLGTYILFRPTATGPRKEQPPYRTQFWVVFGFGFHPVLNETVPWGDFDWGDVSPGVWGYFGYTDEVQRTIVGIIKKWKPSDHICRGFIFEQETVVYGDTDVVYGDETITFGGDSVEIVFTI